ncbi:Myosin I heavy chain kinase [Balamuthia mandrillaris]
MEEQSRPALSPTSPSSSSCSEKNGRRRRRALLFRSPKTVKLTPRKSQKNTRQKATLAIIGQKQESHPPSSPSPFPSGAEPSSSSSASASSPLSPSSALAVPPVSHSAWSSALTFTSTSSPAVEASSLPAAAAPREADQTIPEETAELIESMLETKKYLEWQAIELEQEKERLENELASGSSPLSLPILLAFSSLRRSLQGFLDIGLVGKPCQHPQALAILCGWNCLKSWDVEEVEEIHIMKKIEHENVVQYLGAFPDKQRKQLYLCMELCLQTLGDIIEYHRRKKRPFNKQEIVQFLAQIAKGLHYLHTRKRPIVHRDLKGKAAHLEDSLAPSDRAFTFLGTHILSLLPSFLPLLHDFVVQLALAWLHTSSLGFFVSSLLWLAATVGYIAPEVLAGSGGGYGVKADVWSFGMTLWELITLKQPEEGPCFPHQFTAHSGQSNRPEWPRNAKLKGEKRLQELFEWCMERDPWQCDKAGRGIA